MAAGPPVTVPNPGHTAAVTALAATLRRDRPEALDPVVRLLWAGSSPAADLLRRPAVRTPALTHGAAEIWLRASWEPATPEVGAVTGAQRVITTSVTAVVPGTTVPPRVNPLELDAWAAALYPDWWAPVQWPLPVRVLACTREYVTFLTADGAPLALPEHVARRLPA